MPHSYWDIYVPASKGDVHVSCLEIEMFATIGGADQCAGGTPVYSSQFNGTTSAAANAYDNNNLTGWDTAVGAIPASNGYQFAAPIDIVGFSWRAHPTLARNPAQMILRYSDDGIAWTNFLDVGYQAAWSVGEVRTFYVSLTDIEVSAVSMDSLPGVIEEESVASVSMETVIGASPAEIWVSSVSMDTVEGGRIGEIAVDLLVMETVIGPPLPRPFVPGGPDPVLIPGEEDCTEQGEGCCVPDLNRVIEMRMGPLNSIEDIRTALWYVQDRHNVLVREFNKLATVTRPDPPSV